MAKSYHATLGISSMATADEVRAAYRRLVKAYHPDHYHGGSENFRQVQEAYRILGNPERRRQYERQLHKTANARVFSA
jgi:molecular chaperone DnaJ